MVVMPCVRRQEEVWFNVQLAGLNDGGLVPYACLVPLHQPFDLELRWASWGKTMWRFFKAWCVSRVTLCIPMVVWGRACPGGRSGLVGHLQRCSLCGVASAGLAHVLSTCPALQVHRLALPLDMLPVSVACMLSYEGDFFALEAKVKYFGLCVSAVVHGLPE